MLLNNKLIYCLLHNKRFNIEIISNLGNKYFCFRTQGSKILYLRFYDSRFILYIYTSNFIGNLVLYKKLDDLERNARKHYNKLSC